MVDISVRDTGARGDGVTDDTVAIQQAIDECHMLGGGRVLFPSDRAEDSVYVVSSDKVATFHGAVLRLRSKVHLQGFGRIPVAVRLKRSAGSNDRVASTPIEKDEEPADDIVVRDLRFDGGLNETPGGEQGHLLFLAGVQGLAVKNCVFHNVNGTAIYVTNRISRGKLSSQVEIARCRFEAPFREAIIVNGGVDVTVSENVALVSERVLGEVFFSSEGAEQRDAVVRGVVERNFTNRSFTVRGLVDWRIRSNTILFDDFGRGGTPFIMRECLRTAIEDNQFIGGPFSLLALGGEKCTIERNLFMANEPKYDPSAGGILRLSSNADTPAPEGFLVKRNRLLDISTRTGITFHDVTNSVLCENYFQGSGYNVGGVSYLQSFADLRGMTSGCVVAWNRAQAAGFGAGVSQNGGSGTKFGGNHFEGCLNGPYFARSATVRDANNFDAEVVLLE